MSGRTVFMFSGQGSQYYQMGRALFDGHEVFRGCMLRLDEMVWRLSGRRVAEAIYSASKAETFDRTALTHPAIFMVEYALAQCLMYEGVEPDVTLGASLGSFAAAAVAGCMDLEDALAAVLEQAASFEAACERGGMISILADPALFDREEFLHRRSEMAGVNFDGKAGGHFAVAAAHHELEVIELELKRRELTHQRLAVSYAFHSSWIDSARDQFSAFMQGIATRPGRLPLVCCEQAATLGRLPAEFFWRVVRHPIRFRDTVAHLERLGPHRYIDVGPSGTLATFVKYGLSDGSGSTAHAVLTPYGQDRKNLSALLAAQTALQ